MVHLMFRFSKSLITLCSSVPPTALAQKSSWLHAQVASAAPATTSSITVSTTCSCSVPTRSFFLTILRHHISMPKWLPRWLVAWPMHALLLVAYSLVVKPQRCQVCMHQAHSTSLAHSWGLPSATNFCLYKTFKMVMYSSVCSPMVRTPTAIHTCASYLRGFPSSLSLLRSTSYLSKHC